MLVCCIHLLCDWSFRLCLHINYIYCFVMTHLFLLWDDWLFLLLLLIRVFHVSVSWWSFNGDWVTASPLKSPGLLSVFWPFSIMLSFGWSPLSRQLPNLPGPLVTVPKAPITIGIIVTFIFHSFFNPLARSRYLSLFSHSFSFILWSAGTENSTILQILFFFVDYYKVWSSGRDLVIRLYYYYLLL